MAQVALMERSARTLGDLYDLHGRAVWAYARSMAADRAAAEDLAAEAFLALARRMREHGEPPDPLGFLLASVRSRAVDEARRKKTAARWRPRGPAGLSRPDASAALAERRERVFSAVRGLDPPLREAVALHALAGLTFEEAARAAGVPRATLESRYALALEKLSFLLREEEQ